MRKITDKKELVKLASFITMGDGGIYYAKKNASHSYFSMNMIEENRDYIEYCKDILDNITSSYIRDVDKGVDRKPQCNLHTLSHPFFDKIHNRIYQGTYKGMDWHAMKMLDWESLAILYMSDGSLLKYKREDIGMKNESYTLTLNLKRLSYGDLFLLKKYLKDILDLEFNINKQPRRDRRGYYYYLRLRMKDIHKFMDNIKEYILPSFSYKMLDEKPLSEGDDIV